MYKVHMPSHNMESTTVTEAIRGHNYSNTQARQGKLHELACRSVRAVSWTASLLLQRHIPSDAPVATERWRRGNLESFAVSPGMRRAIGDPVVSLPNLLRIKLA